MNPISNPHYSRPLDVHRWSDHPEVKALADRIWEWAIEGKIAERGSGPKPKMGFRKQLRVVVLDLYVAWLDDPELSIGVSMSPNSYNTGSRYNALHISKKIITIIEELAAAGLIDLAKGSYSGPGAQGNRTTRIRASIKLQGWFEKAKIEREDIGRAVGEEIIILKDSDNKQIEYEDTPDTSRMREELQAYNDLIAASFIDVPTLEHPVIVFGDLIDGRYVGLDKKRTHRVFSRETWELHGRFYGGWWQQVNSEWRSKITIDTEPVIEADYQGLHVAMLYAQVGLDLLHDPYLVSDGTIDGFAAEKARKTAKRLVLTSINAREKSAAYKAFRESFSKGDPAKNLTNKQLDTLLDAILSRNPCLGDRLFSDEGIRLMNLDARITELVHNHFTTKGIPVLSVHDSYLVDCRHVGELRQVMLDASEEVTGRPLRMSYDVPGREEFQDVDEASLQKHIHDLRWAVYETEQSACEGYIQRLLHFQERTGRVISPFETANPGG